MSQLPNAEGQRKHRQALIEAVKALYVAGHLCDVEEYVSYFAANARMTVLGNPVLTPLAGVRIGRESIGRYLQTLHDMNVYLGHEIDDIVMDGEHIVVRWTLDIRIVQNGREARLHGLDHIRVRDNQIAEITMFFDTGHSALSGDRIRLA